MATENNVLCGGAVEDGLPFERKTLRLYMWGPHQNIYVETDSIRSPFLGEIPDVFLDLLEIATYVYCADQAFTRGGADVESIGANWRRPLFFKVAVRCPNIWNDPTVKETLVSTLGFLSEDDYSFEFEAIRDAPPRQAYLPFSSDGLPAFQVGEVILFSGGLDSLGGAVKEAILDNRHVALITHKSTDKLDKRRKILADALLQRSSKPPVFFPVNVRKDKNLSREYTQRTRSFLYASLAASVATMAGLSRICFYENGIVSMNLPLAAQAVGSKASRTTHPRVLNGFSKLFSLITDKQFTVDNPFRWLTKADVLREIKAGNCDGLISDSTSCMHTWEITNTHPHCGTCSQCIDRRFAVLAARLADKDPAGAYKVDLFTGEREPGEARDMICAYVESANKIRKMSSLEFYTHYGEASRILNQFDESPNCIAVKVFELHKRHASEVTAVVDEALAMSASAVRERSLPRNCLLAMVSNTSLVSSDPCHEYAGSKRITADNYLHKNGQAWLVRFAGGKPFMMLPSKGMAYLQILLSQPFKPVSATELACTVAQKSSCFMLGEAGEVSDKESISAYKARYSDLKDELERAKQNQDIATEECIQNELAWLAELVKQAGGLGGRLRAEKSDRDRIRKAVLAAIRRARTEISQFDKRLAQHLTSPTLRCGYKPLYSPPEPIEWEIEI